MTRFLILTLSICACTTDEKINPEGMNPGECTDAADNDGDGDYDCDDSDCFASPDCEEDTGDTADTGTEDTGTADTGTEDTGDTTDTGGSDDNARWGTDASILSHYGNPVQLQGFSATTTEYLFDGLGMNTFWDTDFSTPFQSQVSRISMSFLSDYGKNNYTTIYQNDVGDNSESPEPNNVNNANNIMSESNSKTSETPQLNFREASNV